MNGFSSASNIDGLLINSIASVSPSYESLKESETLSLYHWIWDKRERERDENCNVLYLDFPLLRLFPLHFNDMTQVVNNAIIMDIIA